MATQTVLKILLVLGISLTAACSGSEDPGPADAGSEDAGDLDPEDAGCTPTVPTFAELSLYRATLTWDGGTDGCNAIAPGGQLDVTEDRNVDAGYLSRRAIYSANNPSFFNYELRVSPTDELSVSCGSTHSAGPYTSEKRVRISRLGLTARTPQGWTFQGAGLLSELDGGVVHSRGCRYNPCPPEETHLDGGTYVEVWAELRRDDGGVCATVAPQP